MSTSRRDPAPVVLVVASRKGGTGKTTATAVLAHGLAERGRPVVAHDADAQGSLTTWASWAGWPVTVEPFDPRRVHQLHDLGWDVVVDTPPLDRTITAQALALATHVVVPCGASAADYERTDDMRRLIAEHAPPDARVAVLLTRTVTGSLAVGEYRQALERDGWTVLPVPIPRRERYAQAFGLPVVSAATGPYGDALAAILTPVRSHHR